MLWGLLFASLFFDSAHAYVRTMASSGSPLRWSNPSLSFQVNPRNASGLADAQVNQSFSQAFSAWNAAGSRAGASFSQSTSFPAASGYDGLNNVYFATAGGRNLDYGVVAVTEVLYYVNSAQIVDADIVFNDNQFLFTNNEGDTGRYIGGRYAIYLRDVATHEAGHSFGLDHTAVNLSSLIYTAFSGQYALSEDDKTGVRSVYPSAGSSTGAISGTVKGRNGGIFGTHVQAINLSTGAVQAGTLAAADGAFRIGDLPAGKYALMMEPFMTDISSVSSYYRNVDHSFCSTGVFRRSFYAACGSGGEATVVTVNGTSTTSVGTLAPKCAQMGNPGLEPLTLATAKSVTAGAHFGTLNVSNSHYYKISGVTSSLRARAAAYVLYSPMDLKVEILDLAGNPVGGVTTTDNVQNPLPGGGTNYDPIAEGTGLSGDYIVKVTAAAQRLSSSAFPAGYDLLDSSGHYLLQLSVDGELGTASYTDMTACVSVNNRAQRATTRAPSGGRDDTNEDGGVGCGALGGGSGGGPFSGGFSQTLFLLILVQLAAWAYSRKRPTFLPASE